MLWSSHRIRHVTLMICVSLTLSLLLLIGASPAYAATTDQLRITEIMYDPTGSGDHEFLEFYNGGDVTINLSGWTTTGVTFTFGNASIAPGRYGVIVRNSAAFSQIHPGANLYGQYEGKLKGSGELVELKKSSGTVISSVNYGVGGGWPTATKDGGPSLSLNQTTSNETISSCWSPSSQNGGSPGASNSVDTSWSNSHSGSCTTKNYVMTKAASSANGAGNSSSSQTGSKSSANASGSGAADEASSESTAPSDSEASKQLAASKESSLEKTQGQSKTSHSLVGSQTPQAEQLRSKITLASTLSAMLIMTFSFFIMKRNSNHKKKLQSLLKEIPLN